MSSFRPKNMKQAGVDDMVLMPKIEVGNIVENLDKRLKNDLIYTYIGPVLIAVNPFKSLPYFTDKEIDMYQGAAAYENPPHIYALCDETYRNMVTNMENQCCIISGESGAGKTVSAKYVMNYITKVSGGGKDVQYIKDIILDSNPLLEAFGNAKTVRNDNSSRFGKYVEILFNRGGSPCGGKISNFLLEKSRVVMQNKNERSFHIFYQILTGLDASTKNKFGLTQASQYGYLNGSGCFEVGSINDKKEFEDVVHAMNTIGINSGVQNSILKIVAAILHLGNIKFTEVKNHAQATDERAFQLPANLLGIDPNYLKNKIISREMETKWGKTSETVCLEHNLEQANFCRDALSKGIYSRIFSYLVESINTAIDIDDYAVSIGILDIYGFEIFSKNGFEQFCINFVNEKLQQIFIELTLKVEQEEYVREGIKWTPVSYFNNKIVCDMIESRRNPVGIMSVLDDVCATMHAKSEGADNKLIEDLGRTINCVEHFNLSGAGFIITHYAGKVTYDADGFCERNRDVFFTDLILLMQSSSDNFIVSLFPEDVNAEKNKGKPTTSSMKIKTQGNELVGKLMKCSPHYIRCIKPNESKKPYDFDEQRVKHQVEYQGLKENIRIKRAGFAFRRPFEKFLQRFAIVTPETFPQWKGDMKSGVAHICKSVNMEADEWQLGQTMVFIKKPESLFLLEEIRERKFDHYAVIIQKAFRAYNGNVRVDVHREKAVNLVVGKKQRYTGSISRKFYGDYIGMDEKPNLRAFTERKEKILFAQTVDFYDRKFKPAKMDLILTQIRIYLIGREKIKKGPKKNQIVEAIFRKIDIATLKSIFLSPLQDDFLCINVEEDHSILITTPMKTELLYLLSLNYDKISSKVLLLQFDLKMKYFCRKSKGGANLNVEFKETPNLLNDCVKTKASGSKMVVQVRTGQPNTSKPVAKGQARGGQSRPANNFKNTPVSNVGYSAAPNKTTSSAQTRNPVLPSSRRVPPPPVPSSKPMAVALWPYTASGPDELSFNENDRIEILEEDQSGWWVGIINGKKGLFPGNYVEKK